MRRALLVANGLAWGIAAHMIYLFVFCSLPFEASGGAQFGPATLRYRGL